MTGSFQPSTLAQIVTALFGFATLSTGAAALLSRWGISLLIDIGDFTRVSDGVKISAPNVRGWGARQAATGVVLWAALLLGHQVLFQVGLASVLIRQALDVTAKVLDGKLTEIPPFLVLASLAAAGFYSVL
ncbi:MAG: hypothetical protein ACI8S6_001639 [Myxococcota bacterium]|jgi:hypothetical protein